MSKPAQTKTGGRDATQGVIPGRFALSVGKPNLPAPYGWEWVKLTDVARLETGHTPSRKKPEYWDGEIPWVGIKDATSNYGRVIDDTFQHVTQLGIDNSSARILPANTVCLSRTASVGYVVIMGRPMATSQDFVNWVCSENLDYRYLAAILIAENSSFSLFSRGTTHQTIYFPEAKAFHILLPPIHVQNEIADAVWDLSKKIELNRRTNQTLEQIAQTLFKSWFVDFDPVRAKVAVREHFEQRAAEQGEPLPAPAALAEAQNIAAAATIAGLTFDPVDIDGTRALLEAKLAGMEAEQRAQLMETASLFPGNFIEADLHEIPEGWSAVPLSSMINLIGGGTPKRSEKTYWNGDIPWYSVKDAPQDGEIFVVKTEEYITEAGLNGSSTKLLPKGTTIISARGTVGKLALTACEMTMNQSCYGVRPAGEFGCRFNYFNLWRAVETLKRNTHGAVFDTITTKTFDTVKAVSPDIKVAEAFENRVTPMLDKIEQNLRQSLTLSELRDLLLPKLLSGEIQLNPEPVAEAS